MYYKLYAFSEQIVTDKFVKEATFFGFGLIVLIAAMLGVKYLDSYLKEGDAKNNTFTLAILLITVIVIYMYCFFNYIIYMIRNKDQAVWVEVVDQFSREYNITRNKSKRNLHLVNQRIGRCTETSLFDMLWYRSREQQYNITTHDEEQY